jgi:hypothetical protein
MTRTEFVCKYAAEQDISDAAKSKEFVETGRLSPIP